MLWMKMQKSQLTLLNPVIEQYLKVLVGGV